MTVSLDVRSRASTPDVETLVINASDDDSGMRRLRAVESLKRLPMRQRSAHSLCEMAATSDHPARRATAAQVLGFHCAAATFPELQQTLLLAARGEADPATARAIAFALKGTAAAAQLLLHPDAGVREEAVLWMRFDEETWPLLLDHYFAPGRDRSYQEVRDVALRRIHREAGAADSVMAYLLAADFRGDHVDLSSLVYHLYGVLDQAEVFASLTRGGGDVSRTYQDFWPGMRRRERKRVLQEIFQERLKEDGSSRAFIATLADRVAVDEVFGREHRRFVRSLLASMDAAGARSFAEEAESAASRGGKDGTGRLADALVDLVRAMPAIHPQVQEVMSKWEATIPGLQLRAFHVRLGVR